MPTAAPGVEKEAILRQGGFNDQEIDQWKADTSQTLVDSGFNGDEVDNYFGRRNPSMAPTKALIKENIASQTPATEAKPREASTFMDAVDAGFGMSVTGLLKHGQKSDVILPEDAPMFYRIASQVSQLAGDVPAMLAGSVIGTEVAAPAIAAASVAPPVAAGLAAAAASGGAFAAPAAFRKVLMDHYEKGDVQDFSDFWERASGTFIEGSKAFATGALTGAAGVAAKVAAPVAKTAAQLTSEVATMTTVGKALEGQMPQPQDFIDAGIVVAALHGTTKVASKLRDTYAQTGAKPEDVALRAQNDPLVRQDLVVNNNAIPDRIAEESSVSPEASIKAPPVEKVSRLTEEPKTPLTHSEAQSKILSQVGERQTAEKASYSFNKFYKDFVDKFDPIKQATELLTENPEKLSPDENPYILARVAGDAKSKVKYVFEKGALDYKTLAKVGKSFEEIVNPFAKDTAGVEGLDAYIISKRAVEVEGQNKTSGFDLEAANKVISEGSKKYEKAANDLVEWRNNNLKYMRDAGVVSPESYDQWVKEGKSYASFKRLFEPAEIAAGLGGKGSKPGSLKEMTGSNRKIQSPLLSDLENTDALFKLAERNRSARALVELAEKDPNQELLQRVEKPSGTLKENQFEVYREGSREVWSVEDKDVAQAMQSLGGDKGSTNVFMQTAKVLSSLKRFSLTITPDFIIKNLFRDQLTAGTFSKGGGRPIADAVVAMRDIIAKNDHYYNWLKSGGANGAFLELNSEYLNKDVFGLNKTTGLVDKTWNILKKPIDFLSASSELIEQATRLAEFKNVSKGASSGAKVFEGGIAAKEVTVDFSRIGAKMSALNAITAFQNVSIQGLDRTIRAIKENPGEVSAKALAYITVPSVLLWYANKDDERVKQIPRWQKDTFWIIPTDKWEKATEEEASDLPDYLRRGSGNKLEINKGSIYRIPKPQELGILFGSIPERVLEKYFTENPNALKDFGATFQNLVTPSLVPDAIAPFEEQRTNKTFFTDSKIVPSYLEGIAPEYQYAEYTSESAKQLGKLVKMMPGVGNVKPGELSIASPMVIENYARAWSGNLGGYALQLADKALIKTGVVPDPVKPASTLADIPVVKAFVVRYPSASAQSIQDFYDKEAKAQMTYDTIRHLAKTGDFEAVQKEMALSEGSVRLQGIKQALTTQSQFIRLVNKNPDYTASDKRQIIDGVYYGMIETAKNGNDILNELSKALEQ